MTDIVKLLRQVHFELVRDDGAESAFANYFRDAADEIERLRINNEVRKTEIERLRFVIRTHLSTETKQQNEIELVKAEVERLLEKHLSNEPS